MRRELAQGTVAHQLSLLYSGGANRCAAPSQLSCPTGESWSRSRRTMKRTICIFSGNQRARPPSVSLGEPGLYWSGRLDLNQRPLAPQAVPNAAQPSSDLPKSSEFFGDQSDSRVQRSQGSTKIRRNFATNLLPPIEQLLTVRQVAQVFGLSTATVYKWAISGVLPHLRIVNVIRIRPADVIHFICRQSTA